GNFRNNPAFLESFVDDGALDVLDRDGRRVDAKDARALAWSGADATGEVRKVVGLVQAVERFAPEAALDRVIPLRDQVVDRTARGHAAQKGPRVTEWNAAIHAARSLFLEFRLLHVKVKLVPVLDALDRRPVQRQLSQVFNKSGGFAHEITYLVLRN